MAQLDDSTVLLVVMLMKRLFGKDKGMRHFLEKIDTPEELAVYHDAILTLVNLIDEHS